MTRPPDEANGRAPLTPPELDLRDFPFMPLEDQPAVRGPSFTRSPPTRSGAPDPKRSLAIFCGAHLDGRQKTSICHPFRCLLDGNHGRQCPRTPTKARRHRKNHDQSWFCRPWSRRSNGAGRVLLEPYRFHSNGDPQPARTSRRRRQQSTARKSLDLGLRNYSREDLEAARRAGEMLHINVLGLASIAQDVTPELARATIASVSVLGALHASPAVKAALADRTR